MPNYLIKRDMKLEPQYPSQRSLKPDRCSTKESDVGQQLLEENSLKKTPHINDEKLASFVNRIF